MNTKLDELNKKQRDCQSLRTNAAYLDHAMNRLARLRNSADIALTEIVRQSRTYNGIKELEEKYLFAVINDAKHSLLRLAELRMAADARAHKIQAGMIEAEINAAILEGSFAGSEKDS